MTSLRLEQIQSAIYDHHHRDPIAYRILGLDEGLGIALR
jgi:hypothetical protein